MWGRGAGESRVQSAEQSALLEVERILRGEPEEPERRGGRLYRQMALQRQEARVLADLQSRSGCAVLGCRVGMVCSPEGLRFTHDGWDDLSLSAGLLARIGWAGLTRRFGRWAKNAHACRFQDPQGRACG